MSFAQIVLALAALANGGVAVAFLAAPGAMTALVDVSLQGATADNDVRAVYGGVALGLTAFLAGSLRRPDWHRPALWVVALTLGSMASARLLSILLVGPPRPIGFLLQGAELLGFAAAAAALRRLGAPQ